MIVVFDEGFDLTFQIAGQEIVLEQHPVFHRLMPALDFAQGLGMIGHAAHMVHAAFAQPIGKIGREDRSRDLLRGGVQFDAATLGPARSGAGVCLGLLMQIT